jgi:uncharacterized HAD superfamily protein
MFQTYFIDIDGTIVPHLSNTYLDEVVQNNIIIEENLLPGVKEFWNKLDESDKVIFTTARTEKHRVLTEHTLKRHQLRYDVLLMDLPSGPRVLINDYVDEHKAFAVNVKRDQGF